MLRQALRAAYMQSVLKPGREALAGGGVVRIPIIDRQKGPRPVASENDVLLSELVNRRKATSDAKAAPNPASDEENFDASRRHIIRLLSQHVWPKGDDGRGTRMRVLTALGLLITGKILNVQVPFFFKKTVDNLTDHATVAELGERAAEQAATVAPGAVDLVAASTLADPALLDLAASTDWFTIAGTALLGYGAARAGSSLFNELRNAVFTSVSQGAVRTAARDTFAHLHALDLSFHLRRQPAGLTRALDRGNKGIAFVLQSLVFNIAPTIFEVGLVCAVLTQMYGWPYAAATAATMAAYTAFTFRVTSWRIQHRRVMNRADNEAATRAGDSLVNYEAVKVRDPPARGWGLC
ncbi:hypothetical protein H696_00528 [Fonticula alba]|uniref:ABC transmembrane type-1 domain-containing protein n=1 Tax=Fonticula alba TaxID=691883 RepID=A0A058ZF20_FONAL|nr:hypothetical protein H696_00528 [Fonticula alba]KCV72975.1 hypothetical protein H696_00528 [Fonticula alba]|eukprot:XP_009492676.1 hypothetical protein H696_00528 [Fonticula alba]